MSIFSKPRGTIKLLEVEQSMSDVFKRVRDFLSTNAPSILWDKSYSSAVGWKSLSVVQGNPHLLGLAYYSSGHIELRLNQSTRWMNNTGPRSSLYGQEDNTPTGTLAHELGHQFEWSLRRKCGKDAADLFDVFEKLSRDTAITKYGSSDPMEDWAEAYRLFLLNPVLLKRISPLRLDLMVQADKLLQSKTGFKHGLKRTPCNPEFALSRFDEISTKP